MRLSVRQGENVAKHEKRDPQEYIRNLKKNSNIDGENRVAKITVIVFFACRYDSGEKRMILFVCYVALERANSLKAELRLLHAQILFLTERNASSCSSEGPIGSNRYENNRCLCSEPKV